MDTADRQALHKKAIEEVRENNREILFPTDLHDLFGIISYLHVLMRLVGERPEAPGHFIKLARRIEPYFKDMPACKALIEDWWDKTVDAMVEAENEGNRHDRIQDSILSSYLEMCAAQLSDNFKYDIYSTAVMLQTVREHLYQVQITLTRDPEMQLPPHGILKVVDGKGRVE